MMRLVLALCVAACAAFSPASSLQLTQSRAAASSVSMMARAAPKKAAKAAKAAKPAKAAAKKAAPAKKVAPAKKAPAPKKSVAKKSYRAAPKGKGGIFPWITNEAGTYANVVSLSSVDFTSDQGDSWIGWGFMPKSVKALYPKGYKGMFNGKNGI